MRALTALVVALLLPLAACAAGTGEGAGGDGGQTLRVFAAASLTESFTAIAKRFEDEHPGTRVELNFGPSSGLAEQIRGGAPADVYAAASPEPMDPLVADGTVAEPRDFASNRMAIAVPDDNPGEVHRLEDLAAKGLKVAVCQPQVPCGQVAAAVLANAGLRVRPATEEVDVKAVLTKVSLGEVDAGLVYRTDVLAAGDEVRGVDVPDSQNESTTYPIATVTDSGRSRLARQYVDLVLSPTGAHVLADAGFGRP
jgi:molybdate transport system substrate-binding protein